MARGRQLGAKTRNSTADGHFYAKAARERAEKIFDLRAKENMTVTDLSKRFRVGTQTITRILEAERVRRFGATQ